MKTILKFLFFSAVFCGIYWFVFYQTPQEKAFSRDLALAQNGDVSAALRTAKRFESGDGTPQDGAQAAQWYRQAALAGDVNAAYELAELYLQGTVLPKNEEEALVYLQLAAREDEPRAQRGLARFYETGSGGLAAHAGEALFWHFLAAQNGDAASAAVLEESRTRQPELYAQIKEMEEDLAAARSGDGAARLRAGHAYRVGQPVLANPEEAVRLLTLAWQENRLPQAAYELSEMYRGGEAPEQNAAKADELLAQAAQKAYPAAQYALGEAAYKAEPPNYQDAFAWFSNAAVGGYAPAQYMTGFMLMQGQGTEQSSSLAVKFFRDAAQQNHVSAQYVLGQIYVKGLGVAQDKKAGQDWLRRAAQNGSADAQELLNTLK